MTTRSSENGAILVLFAILLAVFVAFAALAIDGARVSISSVEINQLSQSAAIGALEAFRDTPQTSTVPATIYREKLEAAIQRAEGILAESSNSLVASRKYTLVEGSEVRLVDGTGALPSRAPGAISDAIGEVIAGNWFEQEPASGCATYPQQNGTCPCPGGSWAGAPCFRPNDSTATNLTAMQVSLWTDEDTSVKSYFMPALNVLLGQQGTAVRQDVSGRGRAAVVPRIAVYAVDLSRSITQDTHIPHNNLPITDANTNLGQAAEYVFQLDGTTSTCSSGTDNPCLAAATPPNFNDQCSFFTPSLAQVYYSLPETRNPALPTSATTHFRSDYRCFQIDGAHYLIDISVHMLNTGQMYYGPQPLTDILQSIYTTITEIEQRTVPGDELSFIGFDDEILPQRTFGPTNPFDTSGDWATLKLITNKTGLTGAPNNPTLLARLNHLIFPRPTRNTDIPRMVLAANDLLPKDENESDKQLTIFSDFLNSCAGPRIHWFDGTGETITVNHIDCQTPTYETDRLLPPEDNSLRPFIYGSWETLALISDSPSMPMPPWALALYRGKLQQANWKTFRQKNIRVNTVLFGRMVQPHLALKQSMTKPSECMDAKDAARYNRERTISGVDIYDDRNNYYCVVVGLGQEECIPFSVATFPEHLSDITGGFFLPVRPPCDVDAVNAAFPADTPITAAQCRDNKALENMLDQKLCSKWTNNLDPAQNRWEPDPTVHAGGAIQADYQAFETAGVIQRTYQASTWFDDQYFIWAEDLVGGRSTRTICDTRCRDEGSQIQDEIKELYNNNPYRLIRDDT
ncbi:MAG: hypothetical protein KDD69_11430 [Bdellovibrionales bacterium]|nr:hypothetical protein [Bdellovibrionales bacterium]